MAERDYVLGTHDEEVERLGLQHRVWRPRATDAWRRAGFTVGQTLLDVGCGPGFATQDLAEITGPTGRVVAVDRSRRFLDVVESRRLANASLHEIDLNERELPKVEADGAWVRWVFAFVTKPRDLLLRIRGALKPGGVLVVHEYFAYQTWLLSPRSRDHDAFVQAVMKSWRANGGEPDIALDLVRWMGALGFRIRETRPLIDAVTPSNYVWQWGAAFVHNGLARLTDLGYFTREEAARIEASFEAAEARPDTVMVTPGVLEIIAEAALP